jgi:hypothetical protein
MIERVREAFRTSEATPDDEVVEISLLLSGRQASALESAAHDRGLTAAEMVRSLLRDFLATRPRGHTLEAG